MRRKKRMMRNTLKAWILLDFDENQIWTVFGEKLYCT